MKTKNRFSQGQFITVHDELLMDLYKLHLDYADFSIKERIINGERYLVNTSIRENKYEVGLVVKVPEALKNKRIELSRFYKPVHDQYFELYKSMGEKLCFSSSEILFTNILFSYYLNGLVTNHILANLISFKNIEMLRGKSSVRRHEVIKEETMRCYIRILQSLRSKTIILRTSASFRNPRYGVNDKNIMQRFLEIHDFYQIGSNNYQLSFDFGNFGKFICRSRRYSNLLPACCFEYNFNQSNKHCVAVYVAQILFYEKFKANRTKNSFMGYDCILETMPICENVYGKYGISAKEFRKFQDYFTATLELLQSSGDIGEYFTSYKLFKGRCEVKKDIAYQIKLINEYKKEGLDVDNITPSLESDDEVLYPIIYSTAGFNMNCEPNIQEVHSIKSAKWQENKGKVSSI